MSKGRIVILGGGESGTGAAVLASVQGFDTFLSDFGAILPKYKDILVSHNIPFEEGGHSMSKILNATEVVKSPGIPDKAPVVKALKDKGIPVISEIEFAGRYTNARTICITGSNGKTTTTTLIHKILTDAGLKVGLAGNIGDSLAYQVAQECDYDWYAVELSSFQLDGMYDFRADIAVLTNITPDHLDRYDYKFENYIDSKFRVIRNQTPADTFIYSADCPVVSAEASKREIVSRRSPFGRSMISDGVLSVDGFTMPLSELGIRGLHNAYNAMAAVLAAHAVGVDDESIRRSLREFGGVEHRLEFVTRKNGVTYINDSKATNVDSAWYALESMTTPTIWIAGGTDKGNDYSPLKDFAREKVKALVCMGLDNEKLKREFAKVVPIILDTDTFAGAMAAVESVAKSGDTVLLSPACASFDLFKNYEDRGRQFKEYVRK